MKSDRFFTKNTIIAITVLVALIAAVLGGSYYLRVRNRISDEEAKAILESLLPKSYELNEIIWGEGLPVSPDAADRLQTVTGVQYRAVDPSCGYTSIEQLKNEISEVYSPRFVESDINKIMFDGDDDMLVGRYRNGDKGIEIDIMKEGYEAVGKTYIDPASVKVTGAEFTEVYCTVEDVYEDGTRKEREIVLVKTSDGWRLDTPTY